MIDQPTFDTLLPEQVVTGPTTQLARPKRPALAGLALASMDMREQGVGNLPIHSLEERQRQPQCRSLRLHGNMALGRAGQIDYMQHDIRHAARILCRWRHAKTRNLLELLHIRPHSMRAKPDA